MGAYVNLSGQRFGRLTVIKRIYPYQSDKSYDTMYLCRCDCGNEIVVGGCNLKQGRQKSCGCYRSERMTEKKWVMKHG